MATYVSDLDRVKTPISSDFELVLWDAATCFSYRASLSDLGIQTTDNLNAITIRQVAHGFIMGSEGSIMAYVDPVDHLVKKAYSATLSTISQFAITDVVDSDTLKIRRHGPVATTTPHGLTIGRLYYLHPNIPGAITDTLPVSPNYKKPVLYVVDASSYFLIDQPEEL